MVSSLCFSHENSSEEKIEFDTEKGEIAKDKVQMESFLQVKGLLEKRFEPFFCEDIASQLEVPEVDITLTYSFDDGPTLEVVVPKEIINAYYRNSEVTPFANITVEGYERDYLENNGEIIQYTFIKGGNNFIFVGPQGCLAVIQSYINGFNYNLKLSISLREHSAPAIALRASKSTVDQPPDGYFVLETYVDGRYTLQTETTNSVLDGPNLLKPLVDIIKLLEPS